MADRPSPDEQRLLAMLMAGMPDDSIARQLNLSPRTMQRRLRELMDRLGVRTRFQAGVLATRLGWLDGEPRGPADGRAPQAAGALGTQTIAD